MKGRSRPERARPSSITCGGAQLSNGTSWQLLRYDQLNSSSTVHWQEEGEQGNTYGVRLSTLSRRPTGALRRASRLQAVHCRQPRPFDGSGHSSSGGYENQGRGHSGYNKKGLFKLKQNEEYTERISSRLLGGEQVIDAYKSMRDGVVLANIQTHIEARALNRRRRYG